MKDEKCFEETIKKEDVKEQFIKVEFFDTGENKTSMPKHHAVECRGMTQAQIFLASIALLESAIEGFTKNGSSATTFVANAINNQIKQNEKENALEEMLKLLKAAAQKKDKKDE